MHHYRTLHLAVYTTWMADLHGVIELNFLVWRGKLLLMGNKVNVPDSIVPHLFFKHSSKFAYDMSVMLLAKQHLRALWR